MLSHTPVKFYVYNILAPENVDEIATGDITSTAPSYSFSYTFRTGEYGFKIWYEAYGWAQISSTLTVAAAADFTASVTQSSYLGGKITVSGSYISNDAVLRVGAFEGKVVSVTDTDAVFEIPPLIAPEVLTQYPKLE